MIKRSGIRGLIEALRVRWVQAKSDAVYINELGMTDSDIIGTIERQGFTKEVMQDETGDYAYRLEDYLVYYMAGKDRLQFMFRENLEDKQEFIEFAFIDYKMSHFGVVNQNRLEMFFMSLLMGFSDGSFYTENEEK